MNKAGVSNKSLKQYAQNILLALYAIYILMFFLVSNSVLMLTSYSQLVPFIRICVMVYALFYSVVFIKFTLKEYIFFVILAIILMVNYLLSGRTDLILLALLLISFKEIDMNRIVKLMFIMTVAAFLGVISLYLIGVIENRIYTYNDGTIRYTYGFLTPNTMGIIALTISSEIIYLSRKNTTLKVMISFFILYLVFKISGSRTPIVSFFVFIILYLIVNYFIKNIKGKYAFLSVFSLLLPIVVMVSYFCSKYYSYTNSVLFLLNKLFTGRIELGQIGIKNYGVSFLGQRVEFFSNSMQDISKIYSQSYFVIDNSYLVLLINFGILSTIIIIFLYVRAYCNSLRHGNLILSMLMILTIIIGMSEQTFLLLPSNFTLLMMTSCFYTTNENSKDRLI